MREALQASVKRVGEPAGHVRGNEQRTLTAVRDNPSRSEPRAGGEAAAGGRIGTAREERAACEVIRRRPGLTRPVGYEDAPSCSSMVM